MTSLTSLIERIEAATEGSRELGLAIHLALFPDGEIAGWMKYPRGLDGREGYSWDISSASLIFEKRTADGQCPYNGGVPLPTYSTSIDAALTLLPDNSIADVATTGVAWVDVTGDPCLHTAKCATAPLALLAAILRARQAAQSGQAQTEARG